MNDNASSPPDGADVADVADAKLQASLAEGGQEACDELVAKTEKDPGAPFAVVSDLAALKQAHRPIFENLHGRLKKAGCRVGELDKLINAENSEQLGRDPTQAEILVDLAEAAELFHAPDDIAYADIEVEVGGVVSHRATWPIRSRGFRRWLSRLYFNETKGAPNSEAMASALNVIEARAHADTPVRAVHARVGELDGKLYLDLCDEKWRAVEIDKVGWRVVDRPTIRFRRSPDMRALPEPARNGSVDGLRPLLNLSAGNNDDFVLAVAYELSCLSGRGPYPVMVVAGEQGTAKSTRSALLRSVVDPGRPALRSLPREERDLFIAARNRQVLAYDNVSGLPLWLSDALCRIASGAGFGTRQLYTDDEEALFDGARPVILNGIEDIVSRPDLAERSLFSVCEPIADEARRSEAEIWAAFDAVHASVLGALLDAVSTGLRNAPNLKPPALPRMADFAKWAIACEPALWKQGEFLRAYRANIQGAVESVLEASPVAVAVRALMERIAEDKKTQWQGTASELLADLIPLVGEKVARSKAWPSNARALAGRLRRAASFLRRVGVDVAFAQEGHAKTRLITITTYSPAPGPADKGKFASASSAPPTREDEPNDVNGLGNRHADANDAAADANDAGGPGVCARSNPLTSKAADGADGADAKIATLTAAERAGMPLTFEVDGVQVVYCQTYAEAEACIREMIADAAGKPIAVDLETCPVSAELERLEALKTEREAVNDAAIAFRRAAKKAKTPQTEIHAFTETASVKLKALDAQIDHAASAGLDPNRSEIRLLQVYGGKGRVAIVDIDKTGAEALELLEGVSAVIHGSPFDLAHLGHRGVNLGKVHDSQQAARLVLGASKCSLASTVKHYLKVELAKDLQTSDWAAPSLSEAQLTYAARDVIWLWRLCPPLFKDLEPQRSAYRVQTSAAPAIARMNTAGIAIDLDRHAETLSALAEQDAIACTRYQDACREMGRPDLAEKVPRSPSEIAGFLKQVLTEDELHKWKRTKTSWELSTARPELRRAIHYPPLVPLIELSELDGLRLSFGEPLRFLTSPVTHRVHPRYQICGAPTGRSSTSKPNLQGAPRDPRIRGVFRAADGYVLVASDYNCMELRGAAYFFDDPQLAAVFARGDDPHKLTASHVARRPPDAITDEERSKAKNVNFGTIYGIGPASLVEQIWKNYRLVISLAEAETLLAGFASLYPVMIAHRRDYASVCQARGRIVIGPDWREGRGRIVPLDRLPRDQSTTTCAYSYPIQGICSDICTAALTEVDRRLLADKLDGRLVGWIHDELIVETREVDVDQVKALLQSEMARAFLDTFPAATLRDLIEVKVAANWAGIKEKAKAAAIKEPSCAP
jgi:DNA polymerase I-like protein with 3'-5' exonuclease and polymerase domains